MKQFPIYWHDLSQDMQDTIRLHPAYTPDLETRELAIIEVEDADINPADYTGPTTEVTLFYRDGANYKYTEKFRIPTARLESVRENRKEAFYDQDDALISYDHDLGIDRETFHNVMGTTYNPEFDHNFVIIEEIEGLPNTDPDEDRAYEEAAMYANGD